MFNNHLTESFTPPLRIPPSHAGEQSLAEKAKESNREFIEWLTEGYTKGPCIMGNQVIHLNPETVKVIKAPDYSSTKLRGTSRSLMQPWPSGIYTNEPKSSITEETP